MATIVLNVGGTRVETLRSTLMQLEYFKRSMNFNSGIPLSKDKSESTDSNNENKEIFLDADYDIFKHILNKLRDGNYNLIGEKAINMWNYYAGISGSKESKENKDRPKIIYELGAYNSYSNSYSYRVISAAIVEIRMNLYKCREFNMRISYQGFDLLQIDYRNLFAYFKAKQEGNDLIYKMRSKYLSHIKNYNDHEVNIVVEADSRRFLDIVITCME